MALARQNWFVRPKVKPAIRGRIPNSFNSLSFILAEGQRSHVLL